MKTLGTGNVPSIGCKVIAKTGSGERRSYWIWDCNGVELKSPTVHVQC